MSVRKFLAPLAVLFLASFALMGAACNRVQEANPVGAACKDLSENLAVCGYATYGTFVIFEELGAKTAKEAGVSQTVREAIIDADEVAKPVADSLYNALQLYETARAELAAGRTSEEKFAIATANLNRWITEAAPLVADLVKAVNSARGSK